MQQDNAHTWLLIAEVEFMLNHPDRCIEACHRTLAHDDACQPAHMLAALAHEQNEDWQQAFDALAAVEASWEPSNNDSSYESSVHRALKEVNQRIATTSSERTSEIPSLNEEKLTIQHRLAHLAERLGRDDQRQRFATLARGPVPSRLAALAFKQRQGDDWDQIDAGYRAIAAELAPEDDERRYQLYRLWSQAAFEQLGALPALEVFRPFLVHPPATNEDKSADDDQHHEAYDLPQMVAEHALNPTNTLIICHLQLSLGMPQAALRNRLTAHLTAKTEKEANVERNLPATNGCHQRN